MEENNKLIYSHKHILTGMKTPLLLLPLLLLLLTSVNAAPCAGRSYETDCNLLNETACPTYYSNTSGTDKPCVWETVLCIETSTCVAEESSSSSSSSSSSLASIPTTTTTTTTTLSSCAPGELSISWSVIGVTNAYYERCYYYNTGVLQKCYQPNETTICLPEAYDYYEIIRPTTWDVIENPVGAVNNILGLGRPAIGLGFIFFIVFIIVTLFWRMGFRTR